MSYRNEAWFALLQNAAATHQRQAVASMLGVSAPVISQVLNGTGKYGSGQASTARLADKVTHTFGRYPCPHLTQESSGESVVITADQCRIYAHRPAPVGSPRDMQHWQACQKCPHRAASAPPAPREVKPRKGTPNPAATAATPTHQEKP